MKKVTKRMVAILIGIALISVMVTSAMAVDAWQSDSNITSGLKAVDRASAPEVFYKDAAWYLIHGENDGTFNGFQWTGSAWKSDRAIVSGLGDVGGVSRPAVFNKSGTWYLISGVYYGEFYGFQWTGRGRESDSAIVSGLGEVGMYSSPTVFNKDGTWYLIAGEYYSGGFYGFHWTGSQWESDPAIVSGLGSVGEKSAPDVFYKDGAWYLIAGNEWGTFCGYRWTGSAWQSDSAIVSGLGDVGELSTPTVFNKDGTWYLISGERYGGFYGWRQVKTADLTPTAINVPELIVNHPSSITASIANNGEVDASAFNASLSANGSVVDTVSVLSLGVGNSTNVSFAWTPALGGDIELCVIADPANAIDEVYEANNEKCIPVTVNAPDLTPTAINVPALSENLTSAITATIDNAGTLNASAFNVSLSANGTVVDTASVPSLGVGNSTTVSFEWTPASVGDYELCVAADYDGSIVELNETNNEMCIEAKIKPDLTTTEITTPELLLLNKSSVINAIIANTGNADASSFNVSLSANGAVVEKVSVESLGVDNTTNVSFEWIPTSAGNIALCVIADTDNAIAELDEANNEKCIVVTVNAPDLTPTAINVPALFVNQPGTITATIANIGTFDASSFNVSLSANGNVVDTVNIESLSGGNSTAVSFEWTPALGGGHELCVVADPDNEITELNEANNKKCIAIQIKSDLTATAIYVPALIVNLQSTINVTIANVGTVDAPAFNVSLSANGVVIGTANVPLLSAGNTTNVSFEWTPELGGDQELCVVADPDNAIVELSETNNKKCISVTVNAPDLTPTAINVPELFVDQPGTVTATVANVGVLDASAFNVSLSANGEVVGTANVPSLNAGNSTNVNFEWTPVSSGGYDLCVAVDAANEIVEIDEANNDKCIAVTVGAIAEGIVWHYSGLNMPWDAERLSNNNTLITEFGKHMVIEVTPITLTKEIIYGNGTAGSGENQLNCPVDAERLSDGNTLITDSKNHRVIEVDSDKNIVWQYGNGTPGDGTNQLNYTMDAERLANGNTLITEEHNCRIIELRTSDYDTAKPDNNFSADSIVWQYGTTGVSGSGPNKLNYPKDADRLDNGNTIIADYRNHRVIEVNATGEIVWQYGTGTAGSGANQLWYPTDAERLYNNHTLIADHSNHRVIEVNEAKERVWQYGTGVAGSGANELFNPADAERLSNGNMLIADKDNNRVIEVVPGAIDVIPIAMATTPPTLYAGLTLCEVTTTMFNNGSAHSGRFHASLYADGIEMDTTTVDDIPAGDSRNVTLEWLPTQPGDYNLTVIADSDDVIVETKEGNNELTIEVSVLPTTVKRLTFDSNSSVNPGIAADSVGNLHFVWYDDLGEGSGLYYKKLAPDGSVLVTDKRVCSGSGPKTAVDSNGNVHVVFSGTYYLKLDNNGEILVEPKQFASGTARGIAVDHEGNVHVVGGGGGCSDTKITYAKLDNEGNELVNYTVDSVPHKPLYGRWDCIGAPSGIAVDSAGNAYTAYMKGSGACGGSGCDGFTCWWPSCAKVIYAKVDASGVHLQDLTGDLPLPSLYPSVCVDSGDNKHVIWSQHNGSGSVGTNCVPYCLQGGGFDFYYTKFSKSDDKVIDGKRLTYEDYPPDSYWDNGCHLPGVAHPVVDTESGVIHLAWSRESEIYCMGFDTSGGHANKQDRDFNSRRKLRGAMHRCMPEWWASRVDG